MGGRRVWAVKSNDVFTPIVVLLAASDSAVTEVATARILSSRPFHPSFDREDRLIVQTPSARDGNIIRSGGVEAGASPYLPGGSGGVLNDAIVPTDRRIGACQDGPIREMVYPLEVAVPHRRLVLLVRRRCVAVVDVHNRVRRWRN